MMWLLAQQTQWQSCDLLLFALRSLPGAAEVVGFVNLQIFIEKMNRRMHHAFKGLKHDIENSFAEVPVLSTAVGWIENSWAT